MLKMETNRLAQAICRTYEAMPENMAQALARKILSETDPRLEPNLREWVNGEPVSDLWIGQYCINAILDIRKSEDFLDALDVMNLYLRDSAKGEARIWRARR